MRKQVSFEEKGKAEIKMEGMNSFFTEDPSKIKLLL